MAYFPTALLSFTAPRDFFDNVGKTAPVVRVNVQLPKEMIDYSKTKDNPPYKSEYVDPAFLAQIQAAVMREYGASARQFLRAFRQGRDLSELAIVNRMAGLDTGVGMSYCSQFGREFININVSPDVVRKLVGGKDDLYMLILYSGNKIAAVKMADIKDPVGKVVEKKTSKAYWSSYNFSTQLKLSEDSHVAILMGLEIGSDGDISVTTPWWRYVAYNTKNTLLESAVSPINDYAWFHPIFNGSGTTIYDDVGGKYAISQTGSISFVSQVFVKRTSQAIAYPTANGQWYGPTTDNTYGFNVRWAGTNGGLYTADQYAQITANPGFNSRTTWGGPGLSDMFELWADNGGTVDHFPVYSNNGTLDKVDIQTASISYTFSREDVARDGTRRRLTEQNSTESYGSLSATYYRLYGRDENFNIIDVRTLTGQSSAQVTPTLHLDNNPRGGMFIEWTEGLNSIGANNPFTGTYTPNAPYDQFVMNFAANGKHFLYRYVINDVDYKINIDRKDYTAAYTNALDVTDLSAIDFILFDIKLEDIKKLK